MLKRFRESYESIAIVEPSCSAPNYEEISEPHSPAKSEPQIEVVITNTGKPTKWMANRYSEIKLPTSTEEVER